jgi:hypothetical protein
MATYLMAHALCAFDAANRTRRTRLGDVTRAHYEMPDHRRPSRGVIDRATAIGIPTGQISLLCRWPCREPHHRPGSHYLGMVLRYRDQGRARQTDMPREFYALDEATGHDKLTDGPSRYRQLRKTLVMAS